MHKTQLGTVHNSINFHALFVFRSLRLLPIYFRFIPTLCIVPTQSERHHRRSLDRLYLLSTTFMTLLLALPLKPLKIYSSDSRSMVGTRRPRQTGLSHAETETNLAQCGSYWQQCKRSSIRSSSRQPSNHPKHHSRSLPDA